MPYPPAFFRAGHVHDRQRGFTLIELLVVLVIIGILASIAYPAYTKYVERGQRADAQAVMMQIAGRLERCYTKSYSYTDCTPAIEKADDATSELYTEFVPEASASGGAYTVIAKGGTRAKEGCETLTLESNGERTPAECW
ncbi:MAG: type IV pilin protein [Halomonas sp.]|nr:type IV pilin protein [Halomonas sp.]MDN6297948.1 type IV pilin protein [Halomonas sp.]MDN6315197.1 type IV pilin protein [Halomonas sp.]MDN6336528.1 type IV pilin protein [Halomonas sp.]